MKKFPRYSVLVTAALVAAMAGKAWSEQTATTDPATQATAPANTAAPGWYPPRHTPGGYAQPWQHAPRWPAPPYGYRQARPPYPQQGQQTAAPAQPVTAATAPADNAELQQARADAVTAGEARDAATAEADRLRTELDELRTAQENNTLALQNKIHDQAGALKRLQDELAARDTQQATLQAKLQAAERALQQAQADVTAAGTASETATGEADRLRNELDELRAEQENDVLALQAELQAAEQALQQALTDATAAGTASEAATGEADRLRRELGELRAAQENNTLALQNKIHDQAGALKRLQDDLAARDTRQATLQAKLQAAEQALQEAQTNASAADAARNAALIEADMLRNGLAKLRTSQEGRTTGLLQDMQAQAAECKRLQDELATRDTQQATLQTDLQATTQALQDSQNETSDATAALSEAMARVELLEGELAELGSEMDSWKTTLVDTGESLADLKLVRDRLQADLNACNVALLKAQPEPALPDAAPAAGIAAEAPAAPVEPPTPASDMEAAATAPASPAPPGAESDSDGDRVADSNDLCPGTQSGQAVDATGCAADAAIALEGVNFTYNSHELTAEARGYLDRVAGIISQHPDLRLQVAGHTDATGDPAYNQWLSMQRAEAVMNYLVAKGVNPGHIGAVGYGGQRPIADNDTVDGLRKNRRVELRRLH